MADGMNSRPKPKKITTKMTKGHPGRTMNVEVDRKLCIEGEENPGVIIMTFSLAVQEEFVSIAYYFQNFINLK